MKRHTGSGDVPAELRDFDGGSAEQFESWARARREWADTHGWPGGENALAAGNITAAATVADEPWPPEAWG